MVESLLRVHEVGPGRERRLGEPGPVPPSPPARYERLEEQLNDLTELHQNEMSNLKQELASMEEKVAYQSYERARDIQVRPGLSRGPTCRQSWQQPEGEGSPSGVRDTGCSVGGADGHKREGDKTGADCARCANTPSGQSRACPQPLGGGLAGD